MNRFIPYEKLPKSKRREADRQKRAGWGVINPITRCPDRTDKYNRSTENRRRKAEAENHEPNSGGDFLCDCSDCSAWIA
jgi:hypothetical protein